MTNITKISVERVTLTDGSHVFNVSLGDDYLPAVSESHAHELADKIVAAIKAHANCEPEKTCNY